MADAGVPMGAQPKRTLHDDLINQLIRAEGLKDERCIHAMRSVDRGLFVQPGLPQDAIYRVCQAVEAAWLLPLRMHARVHAHGADVLSSEHVHKTDTARSKRMLQDRPLPNGPTETISAPHMHAHALQLLSDKLQPGNRVLDVGSVRRSARLSHTLVTAG